MNIPILIERIIILSPFLLMLLRQKGVIQPRMGSPASESWLYHFINPYKCKMATSLNSVSLSVNRVAVLPTSPHRQEDLRPWVSAGPYDQSPVLPAFSQHQLLLTKKV